MSTLTLLIPDFFTPLQSGQIPAAQLPDVSHLQCLLARAQGSREPLANFNSLLCQLLHVEPTAEGALPVAALCYLADFNETEAGWYVRVDPVHLQLARDKLLLLDDHVLQTTPQEAAQLVAELNQVYQEQGLRIRQGAAARWYLHLTEDPRVQTHSLPEVLGRNIQAYLMKGEARQHWQSFMNEVQMLLHASPVNAAREADGRPAINSVWLWGEGSLEQLGQSAQAPLPMQVYADDPLVRGLARFRGAEVHDMPDNATAWLMRAGAATDNLIVMNQPAIAASHADTVQWLDFITHFNATWAPALMKALRDKTLTQLTIHDGNGRRYSLTPRLLVRWWKRKRPLPQIIAV